MKPFYLVTAGILLGALGHVGWIEWHTRTACPLVAGDYKKFPGTLHDAKNLKSDWNLHILNNVYSCWLERPFEGVSYVPIVHSMKQKGPSRFLVMDMTGVSDVSLVFAIDEKDNVVSAYHAQSWNVW